MEITRAKPADAEEIVGVVRRAFSPVAAEYGVDSLPPLGDTAEVLRDLMRSHVVLKAVSEGRIVGSVRGVMHDSTVEIGRLVVEPEAQGQGIGRALTLALEEAFPDAMRFELFTGHRPGPALTLYTDLGYRVFRTEPVSEALRLVYMEKLGRCAGVEAV